MNLVADFFNIDCLVKKTVRGAWFDRVKPDQILAKLKVFCQNK